MHALAIEPMHVSCHIQSLLPTTIQDVSRRSDARSVHRKSPLRTVMLFFPRLHRVNVLASGVQAEPLAR